ncbi:MAG TPA: SIMPL domain-containing protein [Rhodocyclaceae bacterium]|nr:SIMPL domain-containing protein [Rhodocyclaceae bacterium]
MKIILIFVYLAWSIFPSVSCAQNKSDLPTLELSAESSHSAPNDLAHVRVYVEQTDAMPTELAKRVNQRIAEALSLAKTYPTVKTSSAGTQTYPLYGKSGARIESWRMRSDLVLESKDIAALSELVGKLQTLMAVEQLTVMPSSETEQHATDEAMVDAIKAFQARAALAAQTLGKRYRVKTMSITSGSNRSPVFARPKAAPMLESSAAPAPVDAGESTVTVSINGSVELLD